eukprot:TRINITY_DN3049_c0_g1_i2.p1 TRINITY_DN3049_c0_g1~~TRINITY_DN3049_c0_g1_i2.p1  ORF type:complete len:820 (-),score=188.81 TRINITY_DN3049_c0_g1_i2:106-2532(-)
MDTKDKKNDKKDKLKEDDEKLIGEEEEELTEEDTKIKQDLELLVERIKDSQPDIVYAAIQALKKEIRTSTSSMTSVPKPLKFLRPHYDTMKATWESITNTKNKAELADVISWLGMTAGYETRDCLNFKLKGTKEAVSEWGHEYVRHLCAEIGEEYHKRTEEEQSKDDILALVDEIIPFLLKHNAEPDACDIAMEVEKLDKLVEHVDELNYKRVILYLETCVNYLPEPEDTETLRITMKITHKLNKIPETMRIALALDDKDFIEQLWNETEDIHLKRQLAFMLAQHGYYNLIGSESNEVLTELMCNSKRTEYFQLLAKDLDVVEPKLPEDIFKSEITGTKSRGNARGDSAKQNLSNTLVNAFVNAGFCKDKLMTESANEGDYIFKHKDHGRISATASVGMICLWDPDTGANEVDKFSYTKDEYVKAGVMLGVGIVNANIRSTFDIAFTFVSDYISDPSPLIKQCCALALGLSYAGTPNENVREVLKELYEDGNPSMELLSHVALALGFLHVGTCDPDLTELFVGTLLERGENVSKDPYSRYLCLALGLLYLGKQEAAEVAVESVKAVPGAMGKYAALTVETCAYTGTGNVLKVQKLLSVCGEHLEENDNIHQSVAVLGIALIALREEIGRDMVVRSFDHILQYGEVNVRRAVPLALGILSLCDPDISIMDTLSKLSHDHDPETAMGAIFALGLIGAGSNNSRIAGLLRGLADYHAKEANQLFVVRIAQGILHMGKGTISLRPYHSSNLLMKPAAMAGLLSVIHTCFDFKNLFLGKAHYMLYNLVLAMFPRMLMTFDENLEPLAVCCLPL